MNQRVRKFMYYQLRLVYEAIELGMRSARKKPLTKKERAEKRKKRKEKKSRVAWIFSLIHFSSSLLSE